MKLIKEEEKDHKTLAKEYKRLEIFITIFMSIAICLGTFYFNVICFGTECENKSPTPLIIIKAGERNTEKSITEENEENEVSENVAASEEKLPEWAEYLLNQNISEITYETGAFVNDKCAAPKVITKDQLKDVLVKMTSSKLRKFNLGGAGGQCWKGITVKYDDQKFTIFMNKWIDATNNDSNVVSLIEKENYNFEKSTEPDPLWTYEYDWDTSYVDTLLG